MAFRIIAVALLSLVAAASEKSAVKPSIIFTACAVLIFIGVSVRVFVRVR
jgi:hypothetical protein